MNTIAGRCVTVDANPKHIRDERLEKIFNDLKDRKTDLVYIIDQIENHERSDDYFSSLDHYKEDLATLNLLIEIISEIIGNL